MRLTAIDDEVDVAVTEAFFEAQLQSQAVLVPDATGPHPQIDIAAACVIVGARPEQDDFSGRVELGELVANNLHVSRREPHAANYNVTDARPSLAAR